MGGYQEMPQTNKQYREAIVDWAWSGKLIKETFDFTSHALYITQGLLGQQMKGFQPHWAGKGLISQGPSWQTSLMLKASPSGKMCQGC